MENIKNYNGKPCSASQMQIGDTLFTVISVQSDFAKETADEKVKRLILANAAHNSETLSACS